MTAIQRIQFAAKLTDLAQLLRRANAEQLVECNIALHELVNDLDNVLGAESDLLAACKEWNDDED